jgi:glycogen phosphorylase
MTSNAEWSTSPAARALASRLPEPLRVFARLAYNYRWSWTPGGAEAFAAIDPHRWELCGQNPIRLLEEVSAVSLDGAAANAGLIAKAEAIEDLVAADLARPSSPEWKDPDRPVAFLCAEYAIHRSLPIYAGGLGVLAGDILKEASDRALPLVGVGLLYRQGYLHQQLDPSGWQREHWIETDPERLPATLVTQGDGEPLTVSVTVSRRTVVAQIWRVDVGRVPLYLLDTEVEQNAPVDRWITCRVYVGDWQIRLAQYAVLGVGGIRALRAMGIEPAVVHLNEGHAALAPIELAHPEIEEGVPFGEALHRARLRTVFTTHTPVAAGNEAYSGEDFEDVLGTYAGELGVELESLLRVGRTRPEDTGDAFGLTPLGLRMSRSANGVSRVHGQTARTMWRELYPDLEPDDVPITHVTNGVHVPSWMASPIRTLLDRHLGDGWVERASDPDAWDAVDDIPDEELWSVRRQLRASLVDYVRERSVLDRLARGEPVEYAEAATRAFDADVLTVGFARRAASYKRLSLLMHDRDRALRVLLGDRPVQFVLAGKSHPQDEDAKRILQSVFSLNRESGVAERVVFLEDYDMGMASRLVAGCDVWVNVPRAPLEASGTSGMKAALNGGLNLSVLDGWWAEAFDDSNGWGIDSDPSLGTAYQDERDAAQLYELLESSVVPLFYERDGDGIARGWVAEIKSSLRTVGPNFSAARMLDDYVRKIYLEA